MYNRFRELGVPVAITRSTDKTLSRTERLNIMNNTFGATPNVIILSNHINAGGGEGAEVVYPLRTNDVLARRILESIGEEGQIMRKYYQRRLPENTAKDYYYIMRETPNATTLLIEYGFIDNPDDLKKLQTNLLDYVEAVVKAVCNYIGIPYNNSNEPLEEIYIVKKGDTLYSIANKYNMSVSEIKTLNNLTTNNLQVGQKLILKEEVNIEPNPSEGITYTVKSGDSLYKIANQYGVLVKDIISLNNLETTALQIGQKLLIPNSNVVEDDIETYTVKSGDSLYKIANQYGITVNELISANNLSSTLLQIGQKLVIPNSNNEKIYTVKKGDSLWKIANENGITVDKLKSINNLTSNLLQVGQQLIIK